jgi:hypothetical protein
MRASVVFNRLPDTYVLAEAGAELLSSRRGYEMNTLWYEDPRKKSIRNLEHSVAIGTFYAALRAALAFADRTLIDWLGDHRLAGRDPERGSVNYDRVAVPGLSREQPILSDATFTLGAGRYFVEIDRGTTNLESWNEKLRAYEVYRRSPKLQARYGTHSFTVLIVAPAENRMERIAEEVVKVTRQPGPGYLLTTDDRVHPTTIRSAWREISCFAWDRRKIVDRLVDYPVNIHYAPHPYGKISEKSEEESRRKRRRYTLRADASPFSSGYRGGECVRHRQTGRKRGTKKKPHIRCGRSALILRPYSLPAVEAPAGPRGVRATPPPSTLVLAPRPSRRRASPWAAAALALRLRQTARRCARGGAHGCSLGLAVRWLLSLDVGEAWHRARAVRKLERSHSLVQLPRRYRSTRRPRTPRDPVRFRMVDCALHAAPHWTIALQRDGCAALSGCSGGIDAPGSILFMAPPSM